MPKRGDAAAHGGTQGAGMSAMPCEMKAVTHSVRVPRKPLVIELFAGRFGWGRGFVAAGYRSVGFDIVHEPYHGAVPEGCQLVLRDVLTIHGSELKDAAVIVASPPCTEYSYMAMPWKRGKQIAAALRGERRERTSADVLRGVPGEPIPFPEGYTGSRTVAELTALFDACFRLQREASEAAGRRIPMVVENVKGAQPWVGKAKAHFGSFYLWGDVKSVGGRITIGGKFGCTLKPAGRSQKFNPDGTAHGQGSWFKIADSANRGAQTKNGGGSWFNVAHNTESGVGQNPVNGVKAEGINWSGHGTPGYKPQGFNVTAAQRYREERGVKQEGSGPEWFDKGICKHSSRSDSRKAASAMIAEIPLDLARWIAESFKPDADLLKRGEDATGAKAYQKGTR